MNKSESSKFRYEVWEDPNRKSPNFYVKYFRKNWWRLDIKKNGVLGPYVSNYYIHYFTSVEEALEEIQKHTKLDDPAPHIKRWP